MYKARIKVDARCPKHRYNPAKDGPEKRRASCEPCAALVELHMAVVNVEALQRAMSVVMDMARLAKAGIKKDSK